MAGHEEIIEVATKISHLGASLARTLLREINHWDQPVALGLVNDIWSTSDVLYQVTQILKQDSGDGSGEYPSIP